MKNAKTISAVVALVLLSACKTTTTDPRYTTTTKGEYQIANHPWKSAKDCKRRAPVGKFDSQCDIPIVGFRNFSDPTITIQHGGGNGGAMGL